MASDANDFPIYLIDQGGKLAAKLDNTDGKAICLIKLAVIVVTILKTDVGMSALARMAAEFVEHFSAPWFLQEGQGTPEEDIKNVVRQFLDMFMGRRGFPTLCPSDRLRHEDFTGVTHRYKPGGPFHLSSERISLNGGRLDKLLDLEMGSNSAEDKEGHMFNACRIIKFQFVVTILHEIGHIFFTYLGKGAVNTPSTLPNKPSESGFRLEELVFGSKLLFLRDKRVKNSDYGAGSVFMRKQDGEGKPKWFSVTEEAIDSTLDIKFKFPFKKGCIVLQKRKDLRGNVSKMEEREEEDGESEDPGLHPEWQERLKEIDPEGYDMLKETFPNGYKKLEESEDKSKCRKAAEAKLWLQDIS